MIVRARCIDSSRGRAVVLTVALACTASLSPRPVLGAVPGGSAALVVAPASPEAEAKLRYNEGVAAFEAGRHEEAAIAFEKAFELAGDPTLLYNVSVAYEKAGQLEPALEALEQYIEVAPEAERAELEQSRKGLELRIQRAKQAKAEPVDEPPEAGPATKEPSTASSDRRSKPVPKRVLTPLAITLLGTSVVGLGVGTGLAVAAASANRRIQDQCVAQGDAYLCDEGVSPTVDRRRGLAIGADVSIAIGAATGIAAIIVIATNASRIRRARSEAATTIVPVVGRTTAGITLTTRF